MAKIKIVTDSASDIPLGLAHELGIEIVPIYIHVGDQTYRSGLDITNEPFYQLFQDSKQRVSTSAPPPVVFEQIYRRLAGDYDYVFSIHTSARLSGTLHAAQQAKSRLPASATRLEVLDSKLASMALGLVAIHAARAVRDGIEPAACAQLINQLIQHCHMVFFVDTIEHLEHGGRLAMAQSVLGSMQRIKPLMLLDEGEIVPYERTRTRAKAIEGLYTFVEDFPRVEEVIAMYATTPEDVEKFMEKVDPIFPRDRVQTMQFSPSIGAHLGPGAMGVAVFEGIEGMMVKREF
ncbi:DegV family protein [Chloroflexia bacterium SDU3-3]|nr:DegV family protein [Chloroflexia bacterium SDU3-3]